MVGEHTRPRITCGGDNLVHEHSDGVQLDSDG